MKYLSKLFLTAILFILSLTALNAQKTLSANGLSISFDKNLKITELKGDKEYLAFTIEEVKNESSVDVIFYGPFPTTINETIGEIVGVVRNGKVYKV